MSLEVLGISGNLKEYLEDLGYERADEVPERMKIFRSGDEIKISDPEGEFGDEEYSIREWKKLLDPEYEEELLSTEEEGELTFYHPDNNDGWIMSEDYVDVRR